MMRQMEMRMQAMKKGCKEFEENMQKSSTGGSKYQSKLKLRRKKQEDSAVRQIELMRSQFMIIRDETIKKSRRKLI